MERLFTPDIGLMVWTMLTFLLLLSLLAKFGWPSLIKSIDEREHFLKEQREAAEAARKEAQRIQADVEAKLAAMEARAQEILAKASKDADAVRAEKTAEAHAEAKRMMDKTRAELDEEKRRLVHELRSEVASLAAAAAERLMHKSIDEKVKKSAVEEFFKDIEKAGHKN